MSQLPVQIEVNEAAQQVVYTDAVLITGSPLGFVLNFGQWAPERPGLVRVYSRVGMSVNHLKLLARLLDQNVKGYEQRFGEVMVSDAAALPHRQIGFDPAEQEGPATTEHPGLDAPGSAPAAG